mgnify:CR=1 FL=1
MDFSREERQKLARFLSAVIKQDYDSRLRLCTPPDKLRNFSRTPRGKRLLERGLAKWRQKDSQARIVGYEPDSLCLCTMKPGSEYKPRVVEAWVILNEKNVKTGQRRRLPFARIRVAEVDGTWYPSGTIRR